MKKNNGWNNVPLDEVAKIYNGNSINKDVKTKKYANIVTGRNYIGTKDINFDGSVVYENGIKIPFEETNFKVAPAGSVFVCAEGGSAGKKTAYVNEEVCFGNKLFAIVCNKDIVLGKYLYYYTRSNMFYKQFSSEKTGIIGGVSSKKFGQIKLPVPPISEQKRIVDRIEELFSQLDKSVETLQKVKEQLAVYRQAVYASVFDNKKEKQSITEFFEISGGLTKNSKRIEFPIKMPYLRVANVYYNKLDLDEIKTIGVNPSEVERTLLLKNDLLFVEGNGSKEQIGRVAIWDGSIENCLHQNHLIKGRPNGKMIPLYALYYLISSYGREQILKVASSTSGLYTLSTNKVRNLMIPYYDLEEQVECIKMIERRVSVCDSIESVVNSVLKQAEAMRQSILKQAFEGSI